MYIGICFSRISLMYNKDVSIDLEGNWYNIFYNIKNWHVKN